MKRKHCKTFALLVVVSISTWYLLSQTTSASIKDMTRSDEDTMITTGIGALEATESDMNHWANVEKQYSSSAIRSEADAIQQSLAVENYSTLLPSLSFANKNPVAIQTSPVNVTASWILTSRSFYYFAQETNYSCGPACVRMILRNITGVTYSESTIRSGCKTTTSGTYLSNMVTYTNSLQNHNYYVARYQQSKTNMQNDLYSGITTFDSPPIVGLRESIVNGWNYNLSAHFVALYAVRSDKSSFLLTDPWSGYIGDLANRDLNKSISELYDAYNSVNVGFMY